MIEMRDQSPYVALAAKAFDEAQATANRAKDVLNRELYEAFAALWSGIKGGDYILWNGMVGKAVIQRNGTQMGMYFRGEDRILRAIDIRDHVIPAPRLKPGPKPKPSQRSWYRHEPHSHSILVLPAAYITTETLKGLR